MLYGFRGGRKTSSGRIRKGGGFVEVTIERGLEGYVGLDERLE